MCSQRVSRDAHVLVVSCSKARLATFLEDSREDTGGSHEGSNPEVHKHREANCDDDEELHDEEANVSMKARAAELPNLYTCVSSARKYKAPAEKPI